MKAIAKDKLLHFDSFRQIEIDQIIDYERLADNRKMKSNEWFPHENHRIYFNQTKYSDLTELQFNYLFTKLDQKTLLPIENSHECKQDGKCKLKFEYNKIAYERSSFYKDVIYRVEFWTKISGQQMCIISGGRYLYQNECITMLYFEKYFIIVEEEKEQEIPEVQTSVYQMLEKEYD